MLTRCDCCGKNFTDGVYELETPYFYKGQVMCLDCLAERVRNEGVWETMWKIADRYDVPMDYLEECGVDEFGGYMDEFRACVVGDGDYEAIEFNGNVVREVA